MSTVLTERPTKAATKVEPYVEAPVTLSCAEQDAVVALAANNEQPISVPGNSTESGERRAWSAQADLD